ncbi:MAG: molybdopterin-dependent oxidoreductase, partial [Dongiaceae bacterium]
GEHLEIGTYVEKAISSELSGNIIDLCPVGALLSKPYAFTARPWELVKTESIDATDAVGASIRIDSRGREVMRILPRLNEAVNEEWISDKARFSYDGLQRQRLDKPYVRENGKLRPATWREAFDAIAAKVKSVGGKGLAAIAGDMADVEAMFALKRLFGELGSTNLECRQDGAAIDPTVRGSYLFNTTIAGIESADAALLVGTNPRWEAALVNTRLRKRFLRGGFAVGLIGPDVDLTYPVTHLGDGPQALQGIIEGKGDFAARFEKAERPMVILGQAALARADGAAILGLARKVAERFNVNREGWNGFNMLHTAAARVGGLDIGFVPGSGGRDLKGILAGAASGEIGLVYLLGADEIDMNALGNAFVVYQGHHGDAGAHRADVILPGAAYTEKSATYVNTEGRVQRTRLAVFPPGDAREDWTILRALSAVLGQPLDFDNLDELRRKIYEAHPHLAGVGGIEPASWGEFGSDGPVDATAFVYPIENFYMTDPISRASSTMAECTRTFLDGSEARTGTHG